MAAVRDSGAEHAVGPAPDEFPRHGVQGVGAAVPLLRIPGSDAPAPRAGGEVDQAVDDAGSPVDRRGRFEAPDPVTGPGVERHEVAVVGSDVHTPLPDGGRGVDVRAGALGPQEPSARGAERVERSVGVPDEDPAVGDRRRRVEELTAAEPRERLRPPAQPSGARVERVEAPAVGAEIHHSVRERRRAVDLMVGRERPARLSGVDVDRVELVVPGTRVQRLADDERRGLEDTGPVAPDDLPRPGRHRGDHPRLAPREPAAGSAHQRLHPRVVDDPVGDRRRGRRAATEAALPDDLSCPVVDRVEATPLLREVEAPVRDRRRELEHVACLERPAQPVGRAQLEVRGRVCPLHAEAVRRPREAENDSARARSLGRLGRLSGDELLGGRAALILDRAFLVEPDTDEKTRHHRGDRKADQQQEPPCAHRRRTTTSAESRRPETSTTSAYRPGAAGARRRRMRTRAEPARRPSLHEYRLASVEIRTANPARGRARMTFVAMST